MVRPSVVLSPDASRDLDSIYDWIAEDSGQNRARSVMNRCWTTFGRLASFPGMGRLASEYPGAPRVFPISPWIIVYDPLDDGAGIAVLRVLDGRRDLPALLGPTEP